MTKLINDKHARNFNPARFALLQHLHEKALSPEHNQNKLIVEKTQKYILEYQSDLAEGRKKAIVILKKIRIDFPDYIAQANALFDQCKFKQLARLDMCLTSSARTFSGLTELVAKMQTNFTRTGELDSNRSIETLILDQEQHARYQVGAMPYESNIDSTDQVQLKSLKTTRESMKYFNTDKLIERAIENSPANAGPHNPHMLAITSLMRMRDLSPQYSRRFAEYIEAILWLDKNEAKLKRKT